MPALPGFQLQRRLNWDLLSASPDIVTTAPFKWPEAPLLFLGGTGEPPAFLGW
jgi:hypothetical protein